MAKYHGLVNRVGVEREKKTKLGKENKGPILKIAETGRVNGERKGE